MAHDKPHILVIDDDDRLRALLGKYLSDQGFLVTAAENAESARGKATAFIFDLIVLDVMMPGETGLDFLKSLKNNHPPVLMLSALGEAEDRVAGLELGAEDYLAKPFEPKELVLRIRAILRRTAVPEKKSEAVRFGEFRFDAENSQLKRGNELIYLTSGEAQMLKLLALKAGTPVSREDLAKETGGGSERSIDVQMLRLRKKIEENDSKPLYLQTVRGAGYVLYAQKAAS